MNFETSVRAIESYIDNLFRCYPNLSEIDLLNKFRIFCSDNELGFIFELVGYSYFPIAHQNFRVINEYKQLSKVKDYQLN
jgi:hypothetical protein